MDRSQLRARDVATLRRAREVARLVQDAKRAQQPFDRLREGLPERADGLDAIALYLTLALEDWSPRGVREFLADEILERERLADQDDYS